MWKNLILALLSLLIVLLIAEGLARIWVPLPVPYPIGAGLLVSDTREVWVLDPGYQGVMDNRVDFRAKRLTITPLGTRRVPCADGVADDAARLFLIGASQTFGFGLSDEETWANRLQCSLNEREGGAIEVHNLGVPGINVDQYLIRADRLVAPALRPGDTVIVGVTWNDLLTYQAPPRARLSGEAYAPIARQSVRDALRPRLSEPAVHYDAPTWRYRFYRRWGVFVPAFASSDEFMASMNHVSSLFRYFVAKARLVYYRSRDRGTLFGKIPPGTFDNNFLLLGVISARLSRRSARVVVVLLPNRLFFDDYYYLAYSQGGRVFPERDYMKHVARGRCERLGLECVSMFDVQATDIRDRHSFTFDGHYNARGAGRIAASLTDLVRTPGLKPRTE